MFIPVPRGCVQPRAALEPTDSRFAQPESIVKKLPERLPGPSFFAILDHFSGGPLLPRQEKEAAPEMAGTLHHLPDSWNQQFPGTVQILVLARGDTHATICPFTVMMHRDPRPSARDVFLAFPCGEEEPAVFFVGLGLARKVPHSNLPPAFDRICLNHLLADPPKGYKRTHLAANEEPLPNWRQAWFRYIAELNSTGKH